MPESNDIALLRQYVDEGSEEAFATLVTRHIGKVYSVALRFTHNPAKAEEITQAVFIIFAQRAGRLSDKVIISGWLYQTARLTAMTFVRSEVRRARREQEAHMQNLLENAEPDIWPQIAPLLDTAMAGLNEADRNAVVLRFFDDKSLREVGEELGVNEDTAKKRVQRAVEKLRKFFAKRNIPVPVMTMEKAIVANAVHTTPDGLAQSVSALASAKGAAAGGSTLSLIKGTLKLMAWAKVKTAIMVSIVILAAAGTSTVIAHKLMHNSSKLEKAELASDQFARISVGKTAWDAARFLRTMKLAGQLPGIVSNTQAAFEIPWFKYDPTNGTWHSTMSNINYPLSIEMITHANDVNDRYHYMIRKASDTAQWEFLKAWLSDSNITVLKEYPVPQTMNGP